MARNFLPVDQGHNALMSGSLGELRQARAFPGEHAHRSRDRGRTSLSSVRYHRVSRATITW